MIILKQWFNNGDIAIYNMGYIIYNNNNNTNDDDDDDDDDDNAQYVKIIYDIVFIQ